MKTTYLLHIEEKLLNKLKKLKKKEDRSIRYLIERAITEFLDKDKK